MSYKRSQCLVILTRNGVGDVLELRQSATRPTDTAAAELIRVKALAFLPREFCSHQPDVVQLFKQNGIHVAQNGDELQIGEDDKLDVIEVAIDERPHEEVTPRSITRASVDENPKVEVRPVIVSTTPQVPKHASSKVEVKSVSVSPISHKPEGACPKAEVDLRTYTASEEETPKVEVNPHSVPQIKPNEGCLDVGGDSSTNSKTFQKTEDGIAKVGVKLFSCTSLEPGDGNANKEVDFLTSLAPIRDISKMEVNLYPVNPTESNEGSLKADGDLFTLSVTSQKLKDKNLRLEDDSERGVVQVEVDLQIINAPKLPNSKVSPLSSSETSPEPKAEVILVNPSRVTEEALKNVPKAGGDSPCNDKTNSSPKVEAEPFTLYLTSYEPSNGRKTLANLFSNTTIKTQMASSSWKATEMRPAIDAQNCQVFRQLLSLKLSIQRYGDEIECSLLHVATKREQELLARAALDNGADVDAKTSSGCTALHWAVVQDSLVLVELLVGRGATVDAKDANGSTPLHRAKIPGIQQVLLKNGADPNSSDAEGKTPLFSLIEITGIGCVAKDATIMLLDYGADIDAKFGPKSVLSWTHERLKDAVFDVILERCYLDPDRLKETRIHKVLLDNSFHKALLPDEYFFPIFARHLVRILALKFHDKKTSEPCDFDGLEVRLFWSDSKVNKYHKKCQKEVAEMKRLFLPGTDVSVFDLFRAGERKIASLLRNECVVWAIDTYQRSETRRSRPYENYLDHRVALGRRRNVLLKLGVFCLSALSRYFKEMPEEIKGTIVDILSSNDILNLKRACLSLGKIFESYLDALNEF